MKRVRLHPFSYSITMINQIIKYVLVSFTLIFGCKVIEGQPTSNNTSTQDVDYVNHKGRIYVIDINIEGINTKSNFLLDNGCRESFISESLAKKLNLKKVKTKNILDAYGEKKKLPYGRLDYSISGIEFHKIKTSILPDQSFEMDGCNVQGIIGRNLMEKCIWNISLKNGIYITDNIQNINTNNYRQQELIFGTGIDLGFINGDSIVKSIIDLGCSSLLSVTPNTLSEKNIGIISQRQSISNSVLYNTIFSYDDTIPKQLNTNTDEALIEGFYLIGEKKSINQPVVSIDWGDDNYIPQIGSEILLYYDIILDGINKQFYFKNINTEYYKTKEFGFSFNIINSSLYITRLSIDSPAYKSGLRVEDQITEINHRSINDIIKEGQECQYYDLILNEINKNEGVYLKLKNNKEHIYINKAYPYTEMN